MKKLSSHISSEEITQDVLMIMGAVTKDTRINQMIIEFYIRHNIKEDQKRLFELILKAVYRRGINKCMNRVIKDDKHRL